MKSIIFFLLTAFVFNSCTTNYYIYNNPYQVGIYENPFNENTSVAFIPGGERIVIEKHAGKFWHARYKDSYGWIFSDSIRYVSRARKKDYGDPTSFLVKQSRQEDSIYNSRIYNRSSPSGGPVHVNGYYRKNGTYVQPHTRSAPRRKG
jgi:hypothetical protein